MRIMDASQRTENKFTDIDNFVERQNNFNKMHKEDFDQLKEVGINEKLHPV